MAGVRNAVRVCVPGFVGHRRPSTDRVVNRIVSSAQAAQHDSQLPRDRLPPI